MADSALPWRPSRRLTVRTTLMLWLVCLVLTPVALLLQLSTASGGEISSLRPAGVLTFLWLLVAWVPGGEQRWPRTAMTLVMSGVVQYATYLTLGQDVPLAARASLGAVVQAAVTLAFYRWRTGDDNLTPHRPRDVSALAQASLLGAVVVLPLGPAAGTWITSDAFDLLWWVVLSAAWVFVGCACLLLLVTRRPRSEAIPTRIIDAYGLLLVTAACLGAVLTWRDLPLTWIVLLPAIWAGLSLGPWSSAAFSLTGTLAVVVVQTLPTLSRSYDSDDLVTVLVMDALMASFVFTVLLLSLVRDQRAFLAAEVVRHRQEAVDQAGLLGTVFEAINEALVLLDADGTVLLHNGAAVDVLGHERLRSEPARWLRRMGEASTFTYPFNRDGSEDGVRILAVQLARVQYAGSSSVVAIVRDITTERARIEELASFAAVAAHDLKSPLAAVQGWIEVAHDAVGEDPRTAEDALTRGLQATGRMAREIEDWLTYNVVREGSVQTEAVALQPVVEAIAATHPGADFTLETPDVVRADPTLLQHLLVNLIGNAVKYSLPGEQARVAVRSTSLPERGWVHVQVVDAGIGIPAGEEAAVFEPFRRASTVQETYDGSGLGLALCKRIVRRHGGTIRAVRNEGPGTTVTVTLPAADGGRRDQVPTPRPPSP
ncbi:ATP-binding protein [Nocardioides korecus]